MSPNKNGCRFFLLMLALAIFFQDVSAKKIVIVREGYKLIGKTRKIRRPVNLQEQRIVSVRCSNCGTEVGFLSTKCPGCGATLGGVQYKFGEEETEWSVVITTKDEPLLKKIICSDANKDVRRAALETVSNQDLLKDCWLQTAFSDDRQMIFKKISRPDVLEVLFDLFPKDFRMRMDIAEKISDEEVLLRILSKERESVDRVANVIHVIEARISSVVKDITIVDPVMLRDMALETPSETIGKMATWKIDDQPLLREIAMKAGFPGIRALAVRKIGDPTVLLEIARNEADTDVIKEILLALDPKLDKKLAIELIMALAKIPNLNLGELDILEMRAALKVAKLSGDYAFFMKALPIIKTRELDSRGREFISQIPDERILLEIAVNERNDDDFRVPAIERLRKIKDIEAILAQADLPFVVERCGQRRVGELRVEKITDNDVLYKIYKDKKDYWMGLAAVGKMTNLTYLTEILKETDDGFIKNAADSRLYSLKAKQ